MATQNSTTASDFSDRRVFFVHDAIRAGISRLTYTQSCNGPTYAYIADDVSNTNLSMMADRYGLSFDALCAFRDQPLIDRMLAKPAPH